MKASIRKIVVVELTFKNVKEMRKMWKKLRKALS